MRNPRFKRIGLATAAFAVVTVLASCGGGGGSSDNGMAPPVGTTPSNMPPASASASPDGFIAFLKILVANPSDTGQPLDLTGFVAPTSDNTPPDLSF